MAEAAARLREEGSVSPDSVFTKEAIEEFIGKDKKAFLKTKCAECGGSCGLVKKYKDTMSMIVIQMMDQFWCRDCGRVVCDAHRYQHTCERMDAVKAKNATITKESLKEQMEEDERRKEQSEVVAKAVRIKAQAAQEQEISVRKGQRKILALKAQQIEQFLQQVARDPGRFGPNVHNQLLDLYPRVKRISLALYNQFEHPDSTEVGGQDWIDLKEYYEKARELTNMVIMTEEGPLDMRNPWDPPEDPQEQLQQ